MPEHRNLIPAIVFTGALLAVLIGLTVVNIGFVEQNPGGNDFLARWMGARMWLIDGLSPYDPEVSLSSQVWIYGRPADLAAGEDIAHFVYPLHSMIFFGPFAFLEFPLARAIWTTLIQLSLIALPILSFRIARFKPTPLALGGLVLFSVLWYHGMRTMNVGQFAGINAALIGLALVLIMEGKDRGAGIILALTTVKPQMVFLVVPFITMWAWFAGRRQLFWTTVATTAGLVVAFMLIIPDWPLQMIAQIQDYPSYTSIGSPLSIVAEFSPIGSEFISTLLHSAAFVYLLVVWVKAFRDSSEKHFIWAVLMTMVITNWAAFRTATTNFVMMFPVLTVAFASWQKRWPRTASALTTASLLVMFIGIWALFLVTIEGNQESAWVYLPFPTIVFVMLLALRKDFTSQAASLD
jgi:hypothetical protein